MKIYVSGKWEDRYRIKEIMNKLIELGNEIILDWTSHDFGGNGVIGTKEEIEQFAQDDINAVKNCDALVAVADKDFAFKGMYCELGVALALDKPVFIVGQYADSCIFVNHPLIEKYIDLDELYEYVNEDYCMRKIFGAR